MIHKLFLSLVLVVAVAAVAAACSASAATTDASVTLNTRLALVSTNSTATGQGTYTVSTALRWHHVPNTLTQVVCAVDQTRTYLHCEDVGATAIRATVVDEVAPGTTLTYWVVTCWYGQSECGNSNLVVVGV